MLLSFSQWWSSVIRHWFVAILAFVAVVALTVCVILYSPREYRSTARLLLRIGHESATLDPTVTVTGDRITPVHTREDEVETAIGVMHSRSIMEDVVDQVGMEQILSEEPPEVAGEPRREEKPPGFLGELKANVKSTLSSIDPVSDRETAIRALERGFSISAPSKSSLVTVEYHSENPFVAQNLVRAWVESYLTHHAKVNRTQGTYKFFVGQDEELRTQLDAAHKAIRDAKSEAGFVTLDGQQKLLEAQLQMVRGELLKAGADLVEAAARVDSFDDLLSGVIEKTTTEEVSGIEDETHNEMRSLLFQLEVLEKEYAAKYKDSHPKLREIRDQLAAATQIVDGQDQERKEFKQSVNPTHQQIREHQIRDMALRQALGQKKDMLVQQQADLTEEINRLNSHEEQLARLTRTAAVLEERHKLHSVLLEQARLNEVLEERGITSINVVQPASFEERPVTPNKRLCVMAGLFAAFAVSISLPVLLDARKLYAANYGSPITTGSSDPVETRIPVATEAQPPVVISPAPDIIHDTDSVLTPDAALQTAARPR